jgi:hypothetical protein
VKFKDLPKLGEQLDGGIFAGLTTKPDGTHCAVVLLPDEGYDLNGHEVKTWATEQGGVLPSRPVAALLVSTVKDQLRPAWHWTADELETSRAWLCNFDNGCQDNHRKSYVGSAVAVRLIPIT